MPHEPSIYDTAWTIAHRTASSTLYRMQYLLVMFTLEVGTGAPPPFTVYANGRKIGEGTDMGACRELAIQNIEPMHREMQATFEFDAGGMPRLLWAADSDPAFITTRTPQGDYRALLQDDGSYHLWLPFTTVPVRTSNREYLDIAVCLHTTMGFVQRRAVADLTHIAAGQTS